MRIGIIAEGFADSNVIKAIIKKLLGLDGSRIRVLRPEESFDETDLRAMNFSNWELVLESCKDDNLLGAFFEGFDDDAILVVQIDTAERGLKGYDVNDPVRTGNVDYSAYSRILRDNVKKKLEALVAPAYRHRVVYAIAVEETDAWLIPLFENKAGDTASHAHAKETLAQWIGRDRKTAKEYTDTRRNSLDYKKLGKTLAKNLAKCRKRNNSLDLFCLEIEQILLK